jgi:hypothetical protein
MFELKVRVAKKLTERCSARQFAKSPPTNAKRTRKHADRAAWLQLYLFAPCSHLALSRCRRAQRTRKHADRAAWLQLYPGALCSNLALSRCRRTQRTHKHAVPALTSEATCGNLKRKFGEFRAQRTHKHAKSPPAVETAAPSYS